MTPATLMHSIPDHLLGRSRNTNDRLTTPRALLDWCEARHVRPTFFEIEQERARRVTRRDDQPEGK